LQDQSGFLLQDDELNPQYLLGNWNLDRQTKKFLLHARQHIVLDNLQQNDKGKDNDAITVTVSGNDLR
jgi:hypothetical protein